MPDEQLRVNEGTAQSPQRNLLLNVKRPARDHMAAGWSVLILRRCYLRSTATPQLG